MVKKSIIGATCACLAVISYSTEAATIFQYRVFQSAFTDVPVDTIITVELDLASVPTQTTPPYDTVAVGEDQLPGSNNSQFDDLALLNLAFLGRNINAEMGQVVTFNGATNDSLKVTFTNATQTEISATVGSDMLFSHPIQGDRTLLGINMEFNGPNTLLSTQYVDDAINIVSADPFAWDGVAGVGSTTQAPRRLQFTFGPPGYPEINATLVPVPAAVWLFGSGLLGLVAVARRNVRV